MRTIAAVLIALASLSHAFPDNNMKQGSPVTQASVSQPIYAPPQEQPSYVPHATYPYADAYGQTSDFGGYAGSAALAAQYPHINDYTSLIPTTTVSRTSFIKKTINCIYNFRVSSSRL